MIWLEFLKDDFYQSNRESALKSLYIHFSMPFFFPLNLYKDLQMDGTLS